MIQCEVHMQNSLVKYKHPINFRCIVANTKQAILWKIESDDYYTLAQETKYTNWHMIHVQHNYKECMTNES